MDIDVRRNLIIGALDPRHDNVDQASCPASARSAPRTGTPAAAPASTSSRTPIRRTSSRSATSSTCPRATRSAASTAATTSGPAGPARRNDQADLGPFTPGGRGDGRPIWVTDLRNPAQPKVVPRADRPLAQRRADRLLARRRRRRRTASPGRAAAAACSATRRRAGGATRGPTRCGAPGRGIRSSSPAAASRAGRTASPSRRPTSSTTPHGRSTARCARPACPTGNIVLMTEEDFTGPCSAERPHRRRRHHRLARRRAGDELHAGAAVPAERAQRVPPDAGRRATRPRRAARARRTTSSCPARRVAAAWYGQGLRLIDASDARNLRQVGYYYVTGTDPATNPSSLSWDVAWRGDLIYLFDMSRGIEILRLAGGPAASATLPTVQEPAARGGPARRAAGLGPDARVARLPGVRRRPARADRFRSGVGGSTPPHPAPATSTRVTTRRAKALHACQRRCRSRRAAPRNPASSRSACEALEFETLLLLRLLLVVHDFLPSLLSLLSKDTGEGCVFPRRDNSASPSTFLHRPPSS